MRNYAQMSVLSGKVSEWKKDLNAITVAMRLITSPKSMRGRRKNTSIYQKYFAYAVLKPRSAAISSRDCKCFDGISRLEFEKTYFLVFSINVFLLRN
ncbi:hypothetical protein AVEN_201626-1 [Araneus ventricosus]|uniref:Uncharacterized protein n=1 Tax=Araneus ventricosus TaxID=182803 RepID=A0A4Y2GQJ6_ARAVE|nr:hypothetical protein AVEN_6244-1 [Araneus ventricosus]GBO24960.1 hypothetical protein AVEN_201626-1 [Araneus ventricosus]